jgi:tetratricopeptide (TPR) repeat protein
VAEKDFQRAIAIDPRYADAYARLAQVYYGQLQVTTLPLELAVPKMQAAAQQALALDPRNVAALVAMGSLDILENRPAQAKAVLEQALSIDPSDVAAHVNYGLLLPLKQALAHDQVAVLLDPGNYAAQNNLAADYLDLADYEGALAPALAMTQLSPDQIDSAFILAFINQKLRRNQDMVNTFDLVKPSTSLDKQLVDAGRLAYRSLLEPGLSPQALAALESLRRARLSPLAKVNLLQLYLALGKNQPAQKLLQEVCTSDPIACADLAINPVYIPLRGDRGFQKLAKRYTTITLQ